MENRVASSALEEAAEDSDGDKAEQPYAQVLHHHPTQLQAVVDTVQQAGGWWVYKCQRQLQHTNSSHRSTPRRRDAPTHYEGPQQYAEFRGQQAEEAGNAVSTDHRNTGSGCT